MSSEHLPSCPRIQLDLQRLNALLLPPISLDGNRRFHAVTDLNWYNGFDHPKLAEFPRAGAKLFGSLLEQTLAKLTHKSPDEV